METGGCWARHPIGSCPARRRRTELVDAYEKEPRERDQEADATGRAQDEVESEEREHDDEPAGPPGDAAGAMTTLRRGPAAMSPGSRRALWAPCCSPRADDGRADRGPDRGAEDHRQRALGSAGRICPTSPGCASPARSAILLTGGSVVPDHRAALPGVRSADWHDADQGVPARARPAGADQSTERRGALVSRVTSDVDTVAQFLQFGGFIFLVSIVQMPLATVVMFVYSWQLPLVVLLCFLPLFLAACGTMQRAMSKAYGWSAQGRRDAVRDPRARRRCAGGAGVRDRGPYRRTGSMPRSRATGRRPRRAQTLTASTFSIGGLAAGLANAGVLVAGVLLGLDGRRRSARCWRSCSSSRCSRTRCRSPPRC